MGFVMINESFICKNCNKKVSSHPSWSARNHCPFCLYSMHLDESFPWDRLSTCLGLMEPVWTDYKRNKWYMIKHKCIKCSKESINKLAPDDDFIDKFAMLG
jgi:DNA-directed RNA polymerase subunit RPC12/RpoP